jgi:formiminotetrahydrofolate cyclodeaminase
MGQVGSRLAISDIGCGVVFLKAALISGQLNVMINLGAIKNEKFLEETAAEMKRLAEDGCRIADQTLAAVIEKLA